MPIDPFAVVKECKGAALSILVLLATNQQLGGGVVTQEWLERHSGYTDKPVSQALAYLSETGRILRTSLGWILAEASGLPEVLGLGVEDQGMNDRQPEKPSPTDDSPPGVLDEVQAQSTTREDQKGRKVSDSSTTTSAIDLIKNPDMAEEERGAGIYPTRENLERVEANLAGFKRWGVGRNEKTILLAARPEVTPEQIDAIAQRLIAEKRFSTGLLITAVQSGDQPMPNLPNKYTSHSQERDPSLYEDWEQ